MHFVQDDSCSQNEQPAAMASVIQGLLLTNTARFHLQDFDVEKMFGGCIQSRICIQYCGFSSQFGRFRLALIHALLLELMHR